MRNLFFVVVVMFSMFFVSCGFDLASDEMFIGGNDSETPDEVCDETVDNEKPDTEKPDVEKPDTETPDNEIPDVDNDTDTDVDDIPVVSISGPAGINEGESDIISITLNKVSEYRETFYFQFNPDNTDTGIYGRDFTVSIPSFQVTIPAEKRVFLSP